MWRTSRTGAVVAAATVFLSGLIAGNAGAQRDIDWGDLRRPEYTDRDMHALISMVGIDENQQIVVQIFLDEYSEQYRTLLDEARGEMEFLNEQIRYARESENQSAQRAAMYDQMRQKLEAFQTRHSELGEQFVSDVRAVLTDEQMERWEAFERARRRSQMLPEGEISGEEVNLYDLVEQVDLSEASRAEIEPLLEEYAVQLDFALKSREGRLEGDTSMRDIIRALYRGEMNEKDAIGFAKTERSARVRVRDINLQYGDAIRAEILDPEEAAEFETAFKEAAFPRIYGETHGEQVFDAALGLADLEPSVLESIEAMHSAFRVQLSQMNAMLERLTLAEEPREFEDEMTRILSRISSYRRNEESDRSLRDAFEKREEFEAQTILRLYQILSEEQVRQLPRRRSGRDRD